MSVAVIKHVCSACGHKWTRQAEMAPTGQIPTDEVVALQCEVCTSEPFKTLKADIRGLQSIIDGMCDDDAQTCGHI